MTAKKAVPPTGRRTVIELAKPGQIRGFTIPTEIDEDYEKAADMAKANPRLPVVVHEYPFGANKDVARRSAAVDVKAELVTLNQTVVGALRPSVEQFHVGYAVDEKEERYRTFVVYYPAGRPHRKRKGKQVADDSISDEGWQDLTEPVARLTANGWTQWAMPSGDFVWRAEGSGPPALDVNVTWDESGGTPNPPPPPEDDPDAPKADLAGLPSGSTFAYPPSEPQPRKQHAANRELGTPGAETIPVGPELGDGDEPADLDPNVLDETYIQ